MEADPAQYSWASLGVIGSGGWVVKMGISPPRQPIQEMLWPPERSIGWSGAVMAALTGRPVEEVTGRGAGLSDEGLLRKQGAVAAALKINRSDASDALDVLHKVGGLDIAGIAGLCIGGALYRVPVLLDGVISLVAALAAAKLCPACGAYLIASHVSKEPAAGLLIKELGLAPLICAGMGLGEGTGAVAAMPLLDMALAVYRETATFEDIRVPAYKPPC